eukprot:Hpha_TRINITY_DN15290_c2_g1::TRINITY_DN15290_c2_g1_i3::g.64690::m.64690
MVTRPLGQTCIPTERSADTKSGAERGRLGLRWRVWVQWAAVRRWRGSVAGVLCRSAAEPRLLSTRHSVWKVWAVRRQAEALLIGRRKIAASALLGRVLGDSRRAVWRALARYRRFKPPEPQQFPPELARRVLGQCAELGLSLARLEQQLEAKRGQGPGAVVPDMLEFAQVVRAWWQSVSKTLPTLNRI